MCVQFCAWCLSLFGISFPFLAGEIDTPYPSRPCSSATRSLKLFLFSFPGGINSPIFSAPQNFSPILLQDRLSLPGCLWSPYLTVTSLSRWFVSDTFQVFLSQCCTFSKLLLKMDWMVDFLVEAFFSIYTLSRTCLCSKCKRAVENNFIPSPTPMPTPAAAAEESWAVVTKAHLTSVPSGVRPLLSQTRGSEPWVKS